MVQAISETRDLILLESIAARRQLQ